MTIHRNVAVGQWRGCKFYIHVGTTCITFGDYPGPRDGYGAGFEIMTPMHWFRFRRSAPRS
jgi:hypothetical protein